MDSYSDSERRPLLIPRSERRRFVIGFTCLTAVGFAAGWAASEIVGRVIDSVVFNDSVERFLRSFLPIKPLFQLLLKRVYDHRNTYDGLVETQTHYLLKEIPSRTAFGAILGAAQWVELRKYLRSSLFWIVLTSIGYAISSNILLFALITKIDPQSFRSLLAAALNYDFGSGLIHLLGLTILALVLLSNILVGLCQWLFLRQSLHSVWWWTFIPVLAGLACIPTYLGIIVIARLSLSLELNFSNSIFQHCYCNKQCFLWSHSKRGFVWMSEAWLCILKLIRYAALTHPTTLNVGIIGLVLPRIGGEGRFGA